MPLVIAAVLMLALLAPIVLVPLSLVLRFRAGTARRQARGWVAGLNVAGIACSATLLLAMAALSEIWVPTAFRHAFLGMGAGCLLGLLGLASSRWESTPRTLHFTPNRWLVLAITLLVTSRLLYGVWRGWHAWLARPGDTSWLAAAGAAGSLAAGALVLGYYLAFWAGVWRRHRRHRHRQSIPGVIESAAT